MSHSSLVTITAIIGLAVLTIMPGIQDTAGHSSGPVTIYPQVYYVQPGQSLTQDIRVCLRTGETFAVNSITFTGNYSRWAKVEADFPIEAKKSDDGASGIHIPLTVAVPSNFSGTHAVIQTVVDVQAEGANISAPAGIVVFARESLGTHQNLTDCNYVSQLQTGLSYGLIALISAGGALVVLGYYTYRRNKRKSGANKASLGTKILSVLVVLIGSLLLLAGLFLLVVQFAFIFG